MPATAAVSPRTAITRLRQFAQLRAPLCASGRGVFQVHPPRTCCAVALLRLCWRYYACRRCCMTTALHYDPSVPAVSTKECLSCRGRDQLVFRSSRLLPLRLPVVLFACLASGPSGFPFPPVLAPRPFPFLPPPLLAPLCSVPCSPLPSPFRPLPSALSAPPLLFGLPPSWPGGLRRRPRLPWAFGLVSFVGRGALVFGGVRLGGLLLCLCCCSSLP